jgi:hypothetical protein
LIKTRWRRAGRSLSFVITPAGRSPGSNYGMSFKSVVAVARRGLAATGLSVTT